MEVPRPFKCSCTLWPTSGIKNFFSELVTDSENGCFFNPFRMNLVKYPQRNIILPLEKGYPLSSNCYYYSVDILTAKNLVVSKKILWSIPSYQYFGYLCHQFRKKLWKWWYLILMCLVRGHIFGPAWVQLPPYYLCELRLEFRKDRASLSGRLLEDGVQTQFTS